MDIYEQKSRWKIYLAIAGFIIVAITMFYTNYVASRLAEMEQDKVKVYVNIMQSMLEIDDIGQGLNSDITDQVKNKDILGRDIPIILVGETGEINDFINFSDNVDIESELEWIKKNGNPPIRGQGYANEIYYKHTFLLTLLQYFPIIQILLLLFFIGAGYWAFSTARGSEQNRVWAGMAKETAHQLGTPISAIIGWIEHLKMEKSDDEETMEILGELENDVGRLNLIADRFSKIGSEPELRPINVYEELEKCRAYMQRRASRKVAFEFPNPDSNPLNININPPLFDWVVENLIRNALDALDGKGKISAIVEEDKDYISIDISDTGKGIPQNKHKTVFQPGFTTKKRGWGLGLSLAKRIIESYHAGRIFVKKSIVNEGTTFTIKLPKQ